MFFILYKYLPNRPVSWKLAALSALFSSVLWEVMKIGFGYYLSTFGRFIELYGSFGLMVVFFLWIYYSAFTFIFGAEVGWVLMEEKNGS
jgi:membrane protein